ncbi:hypothetical protein ACHAPU_010749 [Fusarium lateritium]
MDAIIEGEPQQVESDEQAQKAIHVDENVYHEEVNYEGDDEEVNSSEAQPILLRNDEPNDDEPTKHGLEEDTPNEDINDGESKDGEVADDAASIHSVSSTNTRSIIDDDEHESYSHPTGYLHRLGLEVITGDDDDEDDPSDVAAYDIVAIHGMHGLSRWTWMTSKPDEPYETWLSNYIKNLPGTYGRVMLYGFDPGDKAGKTWMPTGIYDEAEALLEALVELRRPEIRVCL